MENKRVVTTGLSSQEFSFDWKIQHYDLILQSVRELVNAQKIQITFPAGAICHIETKWDLHHEIVMTSPGSYQANLVHKMVTTIPADEGSSNVYTRISARVPVYHGLDPTDTKSSPLQLCKPGPRSPSTVNLSLGRCHDLLLSPDGSLTIQITLSIFASKTQLEGLQSKQYASFLDECKLIEEGHRKDLRRLQNDEEWADLKLTSMEGDVHPANKSILSVRSPVFAAMFKSKLEESKSGVVKLDDISSDTIKIMLQYINNGKVPPDQFQTLDDFENVVYAADKYELEDLRKYCDKLLAAKWTVFTSKDASDLASKFRLSSAKSAIDEHVKNSG